MTRIKIIKCYLNFSHSVFQNFSTEQKRKEIAKIYSIVIPDGGTNFLPIPLYQGATILIPKIHKKTNILRAKFKILTYHEIDYAKFTGTL